MECWLVRTDQTSQATIGDFYIDKVARYYTLESSKPIPKGRYKVELTKSEKFDRLMPQIMNVPANNDVRIKAGDYSGVAEGTVLIGMYRLSRSIGEGREAYADFMLRFQAALVSDECWITVIDKGEKVEDYL